MGSGGGGSASGAIDYPAYMKTWHEVALGPASTTTTTTTTGAGTEEDPFVETVVVEYTGDSVSVSLSESMNYALEGGSPYLGAILPDTEDVLLGAGKVITDFAAPFTYLVAYANQNFDTLMAGYKAGSALQGLLSDSADRVTAIMDAEAAMLTFDIEMVTLPAFKSGMRDIGAGLSSAIAIGESNIWASKTRALAKSDSVLRWEAAKLNVDLAKSLDDFGVRTALSAIEVRKHLVTVSADMAKLYATMAVELTDANLENAARDKLWDVKVFQYGGNFLGSIAGSAVGTDKGDKNSKMAATATSAVGGAASGALIGAQMGGQTGGYWGAGIGAVAGALYGLLS